MKGRFPRGFGDAGSGGGGVKDADILFGRDEDGQDEEPDSDGSDMFRGGTEEMLEEGGREEIEGRCGRRRRSRRQRWRRMIFTVVIPQSSINEKEEKLVFSFPSRPMVNVSSILLDSPVSRNL